MVKLCKMQAKFLLKIPGEFFGAISKMLNSKKSGIINVFFIFTIEKLSVKIYLFLA